MFELNHKTCLLREKSTQNKVNIQRQRQKEHGTLLGSANSSVGLQQQSGGAYLRHLSKRPEFCSNDKEQMTKTKNNSDNHPNNGN